MSVRFSSVTCARLRFLPDSRALAVLLLQLLIYHRRRNSVYLINFLPRVFYSALFRGFGNFKSDLYRLIIDSTFLCRHVQFCFYVTLVYSACWRFV